MAEAARKETSFEKYDPPFWEALGDWGEDAVKAASAHFGDSPLSAIGNFLFSEKERTVPLHNEKGEFVRFHKLNKDQTKQLRQQEKANYIDAINAEDGDLGFGADFAGQMLLQGLDPLNLMALSAGMGQKAFRGLSTIFGVEAALGGATEALRTHNEGGEQNPTQIMMRAGLQGGGAAALGGFGMTARHLYQKHKGSQKAIEKEVDVLTDRMKKHLKDGLSPRYAKRKVMEDAALSAADLRTMLKATDQNLNTILKEGTARTFKARHFDGLRDKIHLPEFLNNLVQPISSAIRDISPKLLGGLRRHDMGVVVREADAYSKLNPWFNRYHRKRGIPGLKKHKKKFEQAVTRGDTVAIKEIAEEIGAVDEIIGPQGIYTSMRRLMDDFYIDFQMNGLNFAREPNYVPRLVKDLDGLLAHLNSKTLNGTKLQNKLRATAKKTTRYNPKSKTFGLTDNEVATVVNRHLQGGGPRVKGVMANLRERTNSKLTDDILTKYYHDLDDSIIRYVDDSAKQIERNRFFGKNGLKNEAGDLDVEKSVGRYVEQEIADGSVSFRDVDKLEDLLRVRFGPGETTPTKAIRNLRNIFYIGTLGQPSNAATQFGDLGLAAFNNSLKDVVKAFSHRRFLQVKDFNLDKKIAADFGSMDRTAKWLDNTLKWTQFKRIDRMGKNANINAAIHHGLDATSGSPKKLAKFQKEWGEVFGDEFPRLVQDLKNMDLAIKNGRKPNITENIKLLAFNKLADIQPIALSEMPRAYLNVPNGRIFYMLKSFTIKQTDLLRRRAIREIVHGNPIKGGAELLRYGMLFGAANTVAEAAKAAIRGRDYDPSDAWVDMVLRQYGMSEYAVKQVGGGRISTAVMNAIAPPLSVADDLYKTIDGLASDGEVWAATDQIPVIGEFLYNWLGGGMEEWHEEKRKKDFNKRFKNIDDRLKEMDERMEKRFDR